MERNSALSASSPCDVQFQVSLLRLMYPDVSISAQVVELEQLQDPTSSLRVQN